MKSINLFVIFMGAFVSNACAWSTMGEAEVQIRDGVACFTVSEKDFNKADGIIYVNSYELGKKPEGSGGYEIVWGFFLDEKLPLKKGECIPYGEIPKGAKLELRVGVKLPEKAPTLQTGVAYSLGIGAIGPGTPTHGYHASFCLKHDDKSSLVVKKIRESCDE
jgi:hypothetical protein